MADQKSIKRARRLRRDANAAEREAWEKLRTLRALGMPVRRQHPIGPFIVDFAIVSAFLIIEIDGGVHGRPDVALRDSARDRELETLGWRILRIDRDTVFEGELLLMAVRNALEL